MKSFFRKIRHKAVIKRFYLPPNTSILDTSCQDGTFLKVLLEKNPKRGLKVFGVDINTKDITKAQTLIPEGTFMITDNKTLPHQDQTFDIAITSMTLHHMSNPIMSLSEIKRVLKNDGSIYIVDIIIKNRLLYKILNFIKCPEPYHFEKFYSLSEAQDLFTKVGLRIEKIDSILVFPTFTIVAPVTVLRLTK